jgi:hypothetical protein
MDRSITNISLEFAALGKLQNGQQGETGMIRASFVPSLIAMGVMILGALCTQADAQFVNAAAARWYAGTAILDPYYGGWGSGGTTAAESYSRGMADVIRARGEAAEAAARAAQAQELARSQYIENQTLWLEEYNRRRRIGAARREAEQARRRERVDRFRSARDARIAEMPVATQLDPDTGEIQWPDALRQSEYLASRERLDELFRIREETGGSTAVQEEIREAVLQMRSQLQDHIRDYAPDDYIAADKFLSALARAGSTSG